MELLKVSNITKVYNTGKGMRQFKALSGVSFDVHEGEFVAIMGPSGSGKTTLLNILATLDKPTCGEVLLDGHSFNRVKDSESARFRREHLGFVFQDFNLLDSFNLKDNILLPLVLSRMDVNEMERRLVKCSKIVYRLCNHMVYSFDILKASQKKRKRWRWLGRKGLWK